MADPDGDIAILACVLIGAGIGALALSVISGYAGHRISKYKGISSEDRWIQQEYQEYIYLFLLLLYLWYNDRREIKKCEIKTERINNMEALRKVVRGTELPNSLELPESFKRKKLEIIIIPIEDDSSTKKVLKKAGALSNFARPELIDSEKTAWEKAMKEKYEYS